MSRLHRVKAQLPRARARARCSSSAGRRAFFLSAFSALSAARGMRNLEEILASPRRASPRFASFRLRPCVPSLRACVRVFPFRSPRKNFAKFERRKKIEEKLKLLCYCCDIREETFSLCLSLSLSFLRFRRGSEPCSRTKRGNLSRRVVEGKKEGKEKEKEKRGSGREGRRPIFRSRVVKQRKRKKG